MRRRQQDLPVQTKKVVDQKHHENIDNTCHSSRRSTRRSPALILIACGVAIAFFFICYALHSGFGTDTDASSLHQETNSSQSLRGGGTDYKSIDNINNKHQRVIAVGDIHGDKDALIHAFQLAKIVDQDTGMAWIGGTDIVVQIGDLLNKAEPRDQETLEYMVYIEREARSAGGTLIVTVGDHDLHNAPKLWKEIDQFKKKKEPFPSWMRAAYIVERTLFVHGSLSKTVFDTIGGSLDTMNEEAQAWFAGKGEKPKWIGRGDGPIWSRLYSDQTSDESNSNSNSRCEELSQLLNELSVDRMIVGHTVKRQGISSICNNQVWRIDVGLSRTETRAGKIGASEVLELLTDSAGNTIANVLSTDTKLKSW